MSNKIYCGNGTEKETQYGKLLSVTLDLDTLIREYNNHGYINKQGERQIRATVLSKREPGKYGDTHYITLDTWHPDSFNTPQPIKVVQGQKSKPEIDENEDIPF